MSNETETKMTNKEQKEKLKKKPTIVAISGPSGSGKDFLTSGAIQHFRAEGIDVLNVQMTTERAHRGELETKICISPEEYSAMQANGELIGDHVNKCRYGYQKKQILEAIEDAKNNGKIVIIELNPDKQANFPAELSDKVGIELAAWIGVSTTPDQTISNMKERGEPDQEIDNRVKIFNEFIVAMTNNKFISMCDNGPTNRANAVNDFVQLINKAIQS